MRSRAPPPRVRHRPVRHYPPLVLVASGLIALAPGCGGNADYGAPPRLVDPSPERLATLVPGAADATQFPKQALTSEAELAAFVVQCEAEQPKEGAAPVLDEARIGQVYRGDNAVALPPLANDNIFRTTEGNPEFIDPNKIAESAGTAIVSNLFEPVLVKAAGNAPALPAAASRYEVSPDGRTYTFHLRPGIVWSDGRPTTAHDYEYGWKRGLSPELGSRSAQQLWIIEGAQAYNEAKTKDANSVGVRALDDLTLEVRLVGPAPYFPDLVTYIAYSPVPRWAVEAHGDQWTRPANIVTNGPFRLAKWLERDRFELTKNPTFWDAANIALAGAVIYITDSEAQTLTLYESGQTHVARPLSPDGLQRSIKEGRSDLRIDTNACVYYFHLRLDHPPFDDSRVRMALNLAVDKDLLVQHVLGGFQSPALSLVPPMLEAFMGYHPPEMPARDPLLATRLLAAAGYPQGRGFPRQDILYNTSEGHKRVAEFTSRNWEETLGVQMTASNMEWKSLLKQIRTGDFGIARSAWCADYPDPLNFLENFHSASENNNAGYKNRAYDAVLDRARNEPDRHLRRNLLCAAEKALLRDMPFVLMYQYTRSVLIRPEVHGYLPQYQDHHLLRWISLSASGTSPTPAPSPSPTPSPGGTR